MIFLYIPMVLRHKSVAISTFLVRTEDQEARGGDRGAPEAKWAEVLGKGAGQIDGLWKLG